MTSKGFTNHRTGRYVSSSRAHQHVGESFGGYTKAYNQKTGKYYMQPSESVNANLVKSVFSDNSSIEDLLDLAIETYENKRMFSLLCSLL